jgi:hypothetical protein
VSIRRFLAALSHSAALLLPVLAVAVVAAVVLVIGRTHAVVGARLRGGPTEGARTLSYRLELVERHADVERPVPGRGVAVEARLPSGDTMRWHGTLDDEGAAAVAFSRRSAPVAGPVTFRVTTDGVRESTADGRIVVTRGTWAGGARRRGGWVEGPAVNGLLVRAAAGHGVFAVPFSDPLWIDASRAGGRFEGKISCDCWPWRKKEDPKVVYPAPDPVLPARVAIAPLEHATSVSIVAHDRDGTTATLDVSLAVVPGALHVTLEPGGLRVESPILRERAYVAIVTETERITGGTVLLQGTARGTAEGVLEVTLPPEGPLWAVVSSEPDLRSASLVGWPIRYDIDGDPPQTFDVADVLVMDSVGEKIQAELGRVRRVRLSSALFAGAAILLSALLVARRARLAQVALEAHLAEAGTDQETTTKVATSDGGAAWRVVVAVLCFVLAAALMGVFAAWH